MSKQITVVVPTIADRSEDLLLRAMHSIEQQTIGLENIDIHVMSDVDRLGPALMRNVGVKHAETEWVAFLDDDDEMLPSHLENLLEHAEKEQADVVYPWYIWVERGRIRTDRDPLRLHGASPLGQDFDASVLLGHNYIPVTTLVRRSAFIHAGGFPEPGEFDGPEDWGLWLRMLAVDAKFSHYPDRTWMWHRHPGQTGGRTS